MGVNALFDGYPREAVTSFIAALERFHEFYWRVAMFHLGVPQDQVDDAWKPLARLSERQLGAYVSAALLLTRTPARLVGNRDVQFRNDVIHNGYVPTEEESAGFGNSVMAVINGALDDLRAHAPAALANVYAALSPAARHKDDGKDDDRLVGVVNILTTIDVRHPPKPGDRRVGDVTAQFARIEQERGPHGMQVFTEEQFKREHPDVREHNQPTRGDPGGAPKK